MLVTEKIFDWESDSQFLGNGPVSLPMETCVDQKIRITWLLIIDKQGENFTIVGYKITSFVTKFEDSEKLKKIIENLVESFKENFNVRYPKSFRDALLTLKKKNIHNYKIEQSSFLKGYKIQNLDEPFFTPPKKEKRSTKEKIPEIEKVNCGKVDPAKLKVTAHSSILMFKSVDLYEFSYDTDADWLLIEYEEHKIFIQFEYSVQADWSNGKVYNDFEWKIFTTLDGKSDLYYRLFEIISHYELGFPESKIEDLVDEKYTLVTELKNLPNNGTVINLPSEYQFEMTGENFFEEDEPKESDDELKKYDSDSDSD